MRKFDLMAILLIIAAFIILTFKIEKPFWGQFDWTGAWFGTIARNYLQIDISKTKLAPITVAGTDNKVLWTYYNHYPVTYPLIVAGSMAIFGDHEWSIRLVPILFSTLTLGAFYFFCRRFFHPLVGIFGIVCVLATPMFIYYGKLPVHEQPVLFLSLLSVYFYFDKKIKWMTILAALAFLISWTGSYMLFLISIHAFITQRSILRKFLPAYLSLVVIAIFHLLHIQLSSDLNDFGNAVAQRTSSGGSPILFVTKQIQWFLALYSKPLALISLTGLIFWRKPVLIMFFVWGFFQWFVVNRIMWIHDYMQIYFLPFVALSMGLFFWKVWERNKLVSFGLLLITLLLSLRLSFPFTQALLNSKDQTGEVYPVANFIKENSVFGDKILVISNPEFEIHYPSHYFSYYSDRYIKYGTVINSEYKYIVSQDTIDKTLVIDFGNFKLYEN